MLSKYKGPANSLEMLHYLVGETIHGCMMDGPHLVLVLSDNTALVMCSLGGEATPAYFVESGDELQRRLNRRLAEIRRKQAELESVTFLTALLPEGMKPET